MNTVEIIGLVLLGFIVYEIYNMIKNWNKDD